MISWIKIAVAVAMLAFVALGLWQYPKIMADHTEQPSYGKFGAAMAMVMLVIVCPFLAAAYVAWALDDWFWS